MTGPLTYATVSQHQAELRAAAARERRAGRTPSRERRLPLLPRRQHRALA